MHMLVREFARELLQGIPEPGSPPLDSAAHCLDSAAHGISASTAVALAGSPQQVPVVSIQGTASMPSDSIGQRSAERAFTQFMLEHGRQHQEQISDLARQPQSAMHSDELANFREMAQVLRRADMTSSERLSLADSAVLTAQALVFQGQLALGVSVYEWAILAHSEGPHNQERAVALSRFRVFIAEKQGDTKAILDAWERHINLCDGADKDFEREFAQLSHYLTRLGGEAIQSMIVHGLDREGEALNLEEMAQLYPRCFAVLEAQRTPQSDSLMGRMKMAAGDWQARPPLLDAWINSAIVFEVMRVPACCQCTQTCLLHVQGALPYLDRSFD